MAWHLEQYCEVADALQSANSLDRHWFGPIICCGIKPSRNQSHGKYKILFDVLLFSSFLFLSLFSAVSRARFFVLKFYNFASFTRAGRSLLRLFFCPFGRQCVHTGPFVSRQFMATWPSSGGRKTCTLCAETAVTPATAMVSKEMRDHEQS